MSYTVDTKLGLGFDIIRREKDVHATLLQSLLEASLREVTEEIILEDELIIGCNKLEVVSDTVYPKGIEANS